MLALSEHRQASAIYSQHVVSEPGSATSDNNLNPTTVAPSLWRTREHVVYLAIWGWLTLQMFPNQSA